MNLFAQEILNGNQFHAGLPYDGGHFEFALNVRWLDRQINLVENVLVGVLISEIHIQFLDDGFQTVEIYLVFLGGVGHQIDGVGPVYK